MLSTTKWTAVAGIALISVGVLMRAASEPEKAAAGSAAGNGRLMSSRAGSCAAILKDGRILITGGEINKTTVATAELFSVMTGSSDAAPMSTARVEHACATLADGRVLVVGGLTTGGTALNTAEVFDPASGAWSNAGILTTPRSSATASLLSSGKILIAGGETPSGVLSSIELYDPATKTSQFTAQGLAAGRSHHAAAVLGNGKVLIAGGTDGTTAVDTLELYDPGSGTVSSAGRLTQPRSGLAATVLLNGKVYLSGGSDGKREFNTAEIYNPNDGSLTSAARMGAPRTNHLALRLPQNNAVLIIGGKGNGQMMAGAELYIPWWDKYKPLASVRIAQAGKSTHVAALLKAALSETAVSAATSDPSLFPVLSTDKDDYSPGEKAIIRGTGWPIGSTVNLHLDRDPNHAGLDPKDWTVTVDAKNADGTDNTDGSFSTTYDVVDGDLNETFTLTGYVGGTMETAQIVRKVIFTDSQPQTLTIGQQTPNPIDPGQSATYQVKVGFGGNNNACTVTLSAPNPATGTTAQWDNATIDVTSETSATRTLTISTTNSGPVSGQTSPGSYPFTVTVTRGPGCQGNGALTGGATLVVSQSCTAASVTTNPTNQTVTYGNNATFTAAASGSPAATVQWQVSTDGGGNWNSIPAATNTTLTLVQPGVSLSGNRYRAVFTNTCNGTQTATSTPATLTVNAKTLSGSFTAEDKVYDGNTSATVGTRSIASGGIVGSDDVSLTGGTATFVNAEAGTGKPVTGTGFNLTGATASNYALASTTLTTTANITAKQVTGSFTASNKTYDRTTTAAIATRSIVSGGAVGADDVSLAGGTATFDNKNVGTGKTVTATGFSLTGSAAANYTLASASLTTIADITPATVTGSFTASNKVYDATTAATITARSLSGVIPGDITSLIGGTATFADKNVGNGKNVTGVGFSLDGADAGNYALASASLTATANITAAQLTGSFTVSNKVYDATTAATITARSLSGVIAGDTTTLIGGTATFADKNVGNGKSVTGVGFSLDGVDAGNYALASTTLTATANITAAPVTGSFTASNKVYDGTTSAAISGRSITGGVIGGENITLEGGTAAFSDKNVGNAKTVTGTGFTLGGADAGNYSLASATLAATADITALAITGSFTASNKVYDGTTAASIASGTPIGVLAGDTVTLSGGTAIFDTKDVGTNKTVTGTGFTLGGAQASNYTLTSVGTATANITPKQITGSFTASNKTYNGNTNASISGRDLTGKISGDVVSLIDGTATFDNKNVGTGKTVTGAGFTLDGAAAGNYALVSTTLTTTANITAAQVTGSFTASSKIYDGTNSAAIVGRSITGGVIGGENVTLEGGTAAFSDKNVGSAKTVTGTGFTLGGADAGNYSLASATLAATADITPLGITGSFTANNKVYDGTTAAIIATGTPIGVLAGDTVTLSGGTATFDTKDVGTNKTVTGTGFTLGGAQASNYTLTSVGTTTANITPKQIAGSFTASNKTYDGNTTASISGRDLAGKVNGDAVSLIGGTATFDNKNVGTGKTVTGVGFTLDGSAGGNYTLVSTTLTVTANITAAPLTGSFTASSKVYDGTTSATISGRSITGGVIGGESVTLLGGTAAFSDKNVGSAKTVTGTGFTLGGGDAGNYNLASATLAATADITALGITGSFTANNKVYDGTTAATIASGTLTGVLAGDTVTLSGGTAAFDTKDVGMNKTVTGSGFTLGGAQASNYTLTSVGTTAANITPRQITGSFTASNKTYDGNTTASISGRDLAGRVNGDAVSLIGGTATFDTKNVGVGKTVTGVGFTLDGGAAGNYTLVSTTLTVTANITAAPLTGSFTASSKVYDGTTSATISGRSITGGVIGGESVTLLGGTAAFSDKNVGSAKTVTGTGFTLGGADAGNYSLSSATLAATADITALGITGSFTASNKVYDGTTAATIASRGLTGVFNGDAVTLTGGTAAFIDKNVGSVKTVTGAGFTLVGAQASNYTLTSVGATTANITPATPAISIVGGTFDYDNAPHAATASIAGIGGDVLTITSLTYSPGTPITPGTYIATASFMANGNYTAASASATIAIVNPAPLNLKLTGPTSNANVFAVNTPVTFTATFTDTPGDKHTAEWNFDSTVLASPTNVTVVEGADGLRTVTGKYAFSSAGVYKFKVRVTDCASCPTGKNTSDWADTIDGMNAIVVIYDPNGGFVTGGGWIASPSGAYTLDPTLTGKANFGFVSKYQKGANKPSGETEFQFKAGNLNFHSTSYDWLVISGPMAQYKGLGTINGQPGYSFMLTGRDGRQPGGGGIDGFRIKITNTASGQVVYDNMMSASDDSLSVNVQALGGGSIQIQQTK